MAINSNVNINNQIRQQQQPAKQIKQNAEQQSQKVAENHNRQGVQQNIHEQNKGEQVQKNSGFSSLFSVFKEKEVDNDEREYMTFATRPEVLKKAPFDSQVSGLNSRFGFGDIIFTMAQAGKAAGECGGNFMAVA